MGALHPFGSPIDLEPSFSKNQKLFANLFDTAHGTTNKGIFHALLSPVRMILKISAVPNLSIVPEMPMRSYVWRSTTAYKSRSSGR